MVVLAPPGSNLSSKLDSIASHLNARLINVNLLVKEHGATNPDFNSVADSKIIPIVDKLYPELLDKDHHRILFGYPKNLNQIHHLRKISIYPHKVFIINCDLELATARLCSKLFQKSVPESAAEKAKIEMIMQEYKS